ncbi:MAG: NitT/TauT family transport system permease protein [Gaiellaceae bacterium]|jgi:NitT/TauT family transport system permease protein|nr:NitT/TauT family transport system permease protein [Gaiellaceae bacterium]
MASIAVEQPGRTRLDGAFYGARRVGLVLLGLAAFWGLWEAYRWIGERAGITWPFKVDQTNMPHIHDMLSALTKPLQPGGPTLIHYEWHWALFTGKEALVGFALGGVIGFAIAVLLAHSRILRRGLLPYVVISQTIPILAVAPMVVVGLGQKGVKPWVAVSVIAAFLTFFPVAMNTLRGLLSPDPRSLELMRSYAADRRSVLLKLRLPASLPFVFSALKISATASVIGAIIGETPASIQDGLGGAIVNFNQYYSTGPERLWATNIVCAALGLVFFAAVLLAERLILRRAPEHVA